LHEFVVDNKLVVVSHPKAMRKLHDWRTDLDRILKRSASIAYKLDISWAWYQFCFRQGWCVYVYYQCLDWATIFYSRSVSSTSTILVSMWCTSVDSSTTIM